MPADEVLSLTPVKVPKERVQGENPLDTPRSVGVRSSLSGVRDLRLRRFPRRPPGFYMAYALVPAAQDTRLAGLGPPAWRAVRGAARRLEHPHQAPIGGAEVRQVWRHQGGARRGKHAAGGTVRRKAVVARILTPPCP